jgi:hypothetical protein
MRSSECGWMGTTVVLGATPTRMCRGWATALAALLQPVPSLVVFGGVNEAMALHLWAIREEHGAAEFRRRLVKPCTGVGRPCYRSITLSQTLNGEPGPLWAQCIRSMGYPRR